jgi:hypothetical protein
MKIHLKAVGDLREYFGREPQEIELREGAVLGDLLDSIDDRWGRLLPPYMWDAQRQRFRGAIYFLLGGQVEQDLSTCLDDGREVVVLRALSGG